MDSRKWFIPLVLMMLLIIIILQPKISAQNYGCFKNETYVSNSTFDNNLRALLSSLSSNMNDTGFYRAYVGRIPNRAYATALCRTDVQLDSCRSCVREASVEIANLCVNRKQSVLRKGTCTLRYSDEPIFGVRADGYFVMVRRGAVYSPDQYKQNLRMLFDDLRGKAAAGGSLVKLNITFDTSSSSTSNCFLDNGKYTSNSTYNDNLGTLLSSLSSNINDTGFYSASVGRNRGVDTAYAIALCRADINLDMCRACVRNATVDILDSCPNLNKAILWAEFCTLRYSNEPIYRVTPTGSYFVNKQEGTEVSNPDQFRQARGLLMDDLRGEAASGGNLMKVAAGNRTVSDFQTIFALLQCTPDISSEECDACLVEADRQISECCDSGGSVKILTISCNLRYEIGPFYNISRIQEARAIISPPPPPLPVPTVPAPAPAPADSSDPPMPLLSSPPPMPLLSPPLPGNASDNNTNGAVIIIIVVSVVVCLIVGACIGFCLRKKIFTKKPDDDDNSSEFQKYDFATIRAATDNFSIANKLGHGGFGVVYKGKLKNDEEIAVKRLSVRSQQGDSQFNNEVLLVAKLQHRNLVRLLGSAQEGTERLLVYEFVENGSLDRYIFDPTRHCDIDWKMCHKIIEGIAKGLVYLHDDSRLRVIHRDLKAANILLDAEMNPKIADFGLARLFPRDETLLGNTGTIVGTRGYIAPEYARRGELSVKLDVYSFGVLVLEIVRGRNNNSFPNEENSETMLSFAWRNWREGTPEAMIDPTLTTNRSGSYMREIFRCIHIGLLCVQENAIERPIMASVVQLLNNVSTTLSEPLQPAFFVPNSRDMELKKRKDQSINEASITELYPR